MYFHKSCGDDAVVGMSPPVCDGRGGHNLVLDSKKP